jgi:hypothetical protein
MRYNEEGNANDGGEGGIRKSQQECILEEEDHELSSDLSKSDRHNSPSPDYEPTQPGQS